MIFIDDVIENALFSKYGTQLYGEHRPHMKVSALRHQVGLRLQEDNQLQCFVQADYAISRYIERHQDSLDFVDDYVIWAASRVWIPELGYQEIAATPHEITTPNEPTSYIPDTQAALEAAGEQVEIKAKPEVVTTGFHSDAAIVDGLPEDIQRPSEAWAWWLQQPAARGQYWSSATIISKIMKLSSRFNIERVRGVRSSLAKTAKNNGWPIKIDNTKKVRGYGVTEDAPSFDYRLKSRPLEGYDPPNEFSTDPVKEQPLTPITAAETPPATEPEVPPVRYKTSDDGESTIAASEFDYVDGMMLRWSYYDGINYFVHRPWPQSLLPYQVFVDQLPAGICDVNSFELYENLAYTLFKFDRSHCYRLDDFEMWCIGLCARRSFYNDQPWAVMDVQFEAIRQNLIEMGWQRGPINGSSDHYIGPGRLMEANQIADHEAWEAGREVQRKVNEEAQRLRNLRDDE